MVGTTLLKADRRKTVESIRAIPLPTTNLTLSILDILLENPDRRFTGRELQIEVEQRLGRQVNYAGLLKQLRSYANKPGWDCVLKINEAFAFASKGKTITTENTIASEEAGTIRTRPSLCIYAEKSLVSQKLHELLHKLKDFQDTMFQLSELKEEFTAERERVFSDPYCDMNQAQAKMDKLETKLKQLSSQIP